MILALVVVLVVLALVGGVVWHPWVFALLLVAAVVFLLDRRRV